MASFDDDDDLPKLTIPDDDELELESTVVLGGAPKPALPLDLDGTYVLKDEDAAPAPPRRRAPQPPMDIDGTYVLKDEDAVPARGSAPRRPAPQPPLELDGTYVLKDESASPKPFPAPPAELDSTYVLKDEAPAREPGAPAGFDSTYVLKDQDSDLELAVPEDLDSTYVLNEAPAKVTPKAPGRRVQAKTESELEIPELTLKSEAASTRRANALASGDGSAPAGGKLTRDVFQMLAKKRLPFKGYKIADYEIVEEISRGAMGVVLLAQPTGMAKTMAQARGFEGAVALKVMLENGADPKETERFVAEMKVLTKLNHPNIVRIFDCGAENGLTFFSMELLKGQDVRDLVRENGPPPIMLTLRIAAQIANALAYIHKSTVYHRDMKPTNIIFDKSVNPFRAVLIDFGLVTNHGDASDKGLILGTPQYMPPEQAAPRGGFGEVNATSDIYSLGATLYFMLTGRPPFIGSDPRKIIKRVATERVKDPAEINKEIPRRVADICLKCLEKQQRDRYPAARILSAELEKELKASQRMLKAKSFISRFWNPKG